MFSLQGTKFNDIITLHDYMKPWPIVPSGPLFQFHKQFWGKSMEEEEETWRSTQNVQPTAGIVLDDQDPNVSMDEDDEFIQGCYMLDTKLKPFETIWIRADYIRIYDSLLRHQRTPGVNAKAPSAVVTGTPGIGKSAWIYYAMRRRLSEKQPFIWYNRECCYLFAEDGVRRMPDDFQEAMFSTTIWTFVDSDAAKDGIPSYLVPFGTDLFVIYSTSPCKERWSRLDKTTRRAVMIMNPWARTEIHRVASAVSNLDLDKVDEIFDRFGPTPRLCIEFLANPSLLAAHELAVEQVIKTLTMSSLKTLLEDPMGPAARAISHMVCIMSREDQEDVHSQAVISPITQSMQSRIASRVRNMTE